MYCGDVVEISQPLFPIGMKTPISMATPAQQPSRIRAIVSAGPASPRPHAHWRRGQESVSRTKSHKTSSVRERAGRSGGDRPTVMPGQGAGIGAADGRADADQKVALHTDPAGRRAGK